MDAHFVRAHAGGVSCTKYCMNFIADLIVESQLISFVLIPAAILALLYISYRTGSWSIYIITFGMILTYVGFVSLSFPIFQDYEILQGDTSISGSRWSPLSSLLSSLGILGEYIKQVGLLGLAYEFWSGKLFAATNKKRNEMDGSSEPPIR